MTVAPRILTVSRLSAARKGPALGVRHTERAARLTKYRRLRCFQRAPVFTSATTLPSPRAAEGCRRRSGKFKLTSFNYALL